ncbi:hypothetical protein BN7_2299 [Wickerhamomyces ciferrii]|uniref:Uncharacterized protein n=1 Tax=Wickerhamomyces ciferrii (strain ATCC 14091 / BCRC 22168 / CBS 111 / JCM 3599 / NBRC 0793 / NRRL Y-1031 F-60-10) TaxID=1206466 RepID=K0KCF5_WICCF|nr:uncharacterized protein BN7_2299 [Wickerhamomyces ciferrii]CCH42755.1 hypothetical protein BN7_2299 [Wickerhamomyces ciferrii]
MIIQKSGYIIEIFAGSYEKLRSRQLSKSKHSILANNLLLAKSPKHFKLEHETFNSFYKDKDNNKLINVLEEIPKPLKELTLNYKYISMEWRKVNESSVQSYKVEFYSIPGYDPKDLSIEVLSSLIKNCHGDIPEFLNTELFGSGLDMIEKNKLYINILQVQNHNIDSYLPLRTLLESLVTYLMSDEYEIHGSYDHIVKAYEFNYKDQLKIMVCWGEKITLQNYQLILEHLNYMISNDLLSEPHNKRLIALIPGYLNYNINGNNDELPPSYGSSVM